MELFDTHTHLYLPEFDDENASGQGEDAVDHAIAAGVTRMMMPNVDLTTVEPLRHMAAKHPQNVVMAMGLHPTEIGESWRDDLAKMLEIIGDGSDYAAIGEVGIDLYWDRTFEDAQMQALEIQAQLAYRLSLPLIIHCREGLPQTLEVLQSTGNDKVVMHCFGGTVADVNAVRRVGDYFFGIGGVVTFKNSSLREVLPEISLERIVLETDSPYLAPVPHRGKRNHSAYLPLIAETVATALNKTNEAVANMTTANARKLFAC